MREESPVFGQPRGLGVFFAGPRRAAARLFAHTAHPLPLALFRIAFCVSLLYELAGLYAFRGVLLSPVALGEALWLSPTPLLAIWAVVVLFLLAGEQVRTLGWINYALCVHVLGFVLRDRAFDWHVDGVFIGGSILLLILPVDRTLTARRLLVRLRGRPLPPVTPVRELYPLIPGLLIGGIYLDSMLWKLASPMYLAGLGAWAPASLPYDVYLELQSLLDCEWLVKLSGYSVLLFEGSFFLLLALKRIRWFVIGFGLLFHLGITIAFPIPNFSILMTALYLSLIPVGPPSQNAAESAEQWSPRLAFAIFFLVFWATSLLVLAGAAPIWKRYELTRFSPQRLVSANAFKVSFYPWTGFTPHGVFMDYHFSGYERQLAMVRVDSHQVVWAPYSKPDGTVGKWAWGREWVLWTFRTAAPYADRGLAYTNFALFAVDWARREGRLLRSGEVFLVERPVSVSLAAWRQGLLDENRARLWSAFGCLVIDSEGSKVRWLPATTPNCAPPPPLVSALRLEP